MLFVLARRFSNELCKDVELCGVNKPNHDAQVISTHTHLWSQAAIPTLTSYEENIGISLIKLKWVALEDYQDRVLTVRRSVNHLPKQSGHQR